MRSDVFVCASCGAAQPESAPAADDTPELSARLESLTREAEDPEPPEEAAPAPARPGVDLGAANAKLNDLLGGKRE